MKYSEIHEIQHLRDVPPISFDSQNAPGAQTLSCPIGARGFERPEVFNVTLSDPIL